MLMGKDNNFACLNALASLNHSRLLIILHRYPSKLFGLQKRYVSYNLKILSLLYIWASTENWYPQLVSLGMSPIFHSSKSPDIVTPWAGWLFMPCPILRENCRLDGSSLIHSNTPSGMTTSSIKILSSVMNMTISIGDCFMSELTSGLKSVLGWRRYL